MSPDKETFPLWSGVGALSTVSLPLCGQLSCTPRQFRLVIFFSHMRGRVSNDAFLCFLFWANEIQHSRSHLVCRVSFFSVRPFTEKMLAIRVTVKTIFRRGRQPAKRALQLSVTNPQGMMVTVKGARRALSRSRPASASYRKCAAAV